MKRVRKGAGRGTFSMGKWCGGEGVGREGEVELEEGLVKGGDSVGVEMV